MTLPLTPQQQRRRENDRRHRAKPGYAEHHKEVIAAWRARPGVKAAEYAQQKKRRVLPEVRDRQNANQRKRRDTDATLSKTPTVMI